MKWNFSALISLFQIDLQLQKKNYFFVFLSCIALTLNVSLTVNFLTFKNIVESEFISELKIIFKLIQVVIDIWVECNARGYLIYVVNIAYIVANYRVIYTFT